MSFIKISVGLYIAYFAKNNKKIIFGYCSLIKLLFICMFALFIGDYCSFACLHCSCPMNSARGTGLKKKKNQKRRHDKRRRQSKQSLRRDTFKK